MGWQVLFFLLLSILGILVSSQHIQDVLVDESPTTPAIPGETMHTIFVAFNTGAVKKTVEAHEAIETTFGEPFHDEREFVQWQD